jgi:hypothetical protein
MIGQSMTNESLHDMTPNRIFLDVNVSPKLFLKKGTTDN